MNDALKNKVIVNFGDSQFGNFRAPHDISTFISELTGAKTYNVGFGGCRMSPHLHDNYDKFSMYRIADAVTSGDFSLQDKAISDVNAKESLPSYFNYSLELLKSIDFSSVDIITVSYGGNDFMGGQPLDSIDKKDINSFGGALRYSIEKLAESFPEIQIVLCTQTYRFWNGQFGITDEDSNTYVNECGYKLLDFVAKTLEIAEEYGLRCIDNYNNSGINKDTRDLCFKGDTIHPIEYGRRLIAENMSKSLILWFGN